MIASESEIEALVSTLFEYYGYDFSGYSPASFSRRVNRLLEIEKYSGVADLLSRIRREPDYFEVVVAALTVNVTEMFRDPSFYKSLREKILPAIGPKPFIRIWHAGCSTGEEVFSMAILLEELKLLDKSLLYATDINPEVVEAAKKGIFPLRLMKQYADNYIASGGKEDFSKYYRANYGLAKFQQQFIDRMVFSQHNLVSDRSFNEFDLILCRNVLIYFEKDLQNRALTLFDDSLTNLGYLALGSKENIKFSVLTGRYAQLEKEKNMEKNALRLVIIGGSAGSVDVSMRLVSRLPLAANFALVLVLHRKSADDTTLEEVLALKATWPVVTVEDKTPLQNGCIYVAPSDYHLLFEPNGELSLDLSEKINYSRPSIDVSFESAAMVYREKLVAILLTGANSDGTAGLIAVKASNGFVVIQDPVSADMPFMPSYALDRITPDVVLNVDGISDFLRSLQ